LIWPFERAGTFAELETNGGKPTTTDRSKTLSSLPLTSQP
jgi:hypothetical protein